ncbi:hypothetical protein PQX77_012301 [Marasmius sp. AFHP31]|nr:hypothetical protein PQX77_012301 [Marasmius sp. AFHP31]
MQCPYYKRSLSTVFVSPRGLWSGKEICVERVNAKEIVELDNKKRCTATGQQPALAKRTHLEDEWPERRTHELEGDDELAQRRVIELTGQLKGFKRHEAQLLQSFRRRASGYAIRNNFMWSAGHRLPSEVLSEIFFYCVLHERSSTDKLARPEWLGFTGVCHYWRTVALANPRLWNQPDLRHPLMAQEMFHRSRSLPLVIDGHITRWTTTHDRSTVMNVLLEYTSRIQHLRLHVSSGIRLSKVFPRTFLHPAPLLHTIELHNPGNIKFFTLPKVFLGGSAPTLDTSPSSVVS